MDDLIPKLGERIRELRTRRGLTQAQLSDKAGISQATLSRLEGGRQAPSLRGLATIAEALGVSLATVVDFDEERTADVDLVDALLERAAKDPDEGIRRLREALGVLFPKG